MTYSFTVVTHVEELSLDLDLGLVSGRGQQQMRAISSSSWAPSDGTAAAHIRIWGAGKHGVACSRRGPSACTFSSVCVSVCLLSPNHRGRRPIEEVSNAAHATSLLLNSSCWRVSLPKNCRQLMKKLSLRSKRRCCSRRPSSTSVPHCVNKHRHV